MGGFNCGKKRNNINKRRRDGIASVAPLVYIGRGGSARRVAGRRGTAKGGDTTIHGDKPGVLGHTLYVNY